MKNDMKAAVSPMEMDVRIFPYRGDGPVAAIASVTLNGCFAVRDVRIMEGKNGLFVSMPSRKVKGEYRDICYPCTKDFKQQFDQKVLEAYEQAQVQEAQKSPDPEGQEENGPTMAMYASPLCRTKGTGGKYPMSRIEKCDIGKSRCRATAKWRTGDERGRWPCSALRRFKPENIIGGEEGGLF